MARIAVAGFTFLELVIVILIVGIVSVTVYNQFPAPSINVEYELRRVLNDIRFTQAMSMASGQRYRWVRTSTTSYQILNQSGSAVVFPNGSTTMTLSSVSFGTLTNLPSNLVAFDSQGTPYTDTGTPGTALASTASIPLTTGSYSHAVTITAQTGYGAVQ